MLIDAGVKDTLDGGFKDTRDGGFEPGGSVCWGHDTGVVEDNIRDFFNNWSGDASIVGIEDDERILFDSGEYEESETWYIGAGRVRLLTNKYISDSMYKLKFDAQTGSFTPGNTITGATSGATATIVAVYQSGGIGYLYLSNISGTFQDDEIIYESALGSELVTNGDMELDSSWAAYGDSIHSQNLITFHGGLASWKFTPTTMNDGIYSTLFTTTTDNFYKIIAWVYPDDSTKVNTLIRNGANSAYYSFPQTGLTQDSWNRIEIIYEEIAGGVNAFVAFESSDGTSGDWYVDDVSLKQITNAALANGTLREIYLEGWKNF